MEDGNTSEVVIVDGVVREGERVGTRGGGSSTLTTALPTPPALARTTASVSCRDRILKKQIMFFTR